MRRTNIQKIFLLVIFLLAYYLRIQYLPQKSLTFGYDQARDHIQARNIINGDFKILGPPASTPGMHHGVFWFYYLVPPSLISGGNPIASAYWNSFFNASIVFVVYMLAFSMTKKKSAAYLSAFLYAISFEATQYATWLSNPTVGAWTVPVMYLGLWSWIKDKSKWAPALAGLGLGLSIQANVFLFYQSIPVLLWLWIARKNVTKNSLAKFAFTGLLATSTMIISEIKFGFKSVSGILSLASSQDAVIASKKFGDFIVLFFNQIGNVYSYNSYPGNVAYGGALVLTLMVVALVSWHKSKSLGPCNSKSGVEWEPFLAVWLLSHITVVSLGGASTPFLLVGIGPAVSLLLGIFIYKLWLEKKKALAAFITLFVIFGNLNMIFSENKRGQTIFAIQKDMLLAKQLEAIDYTYESSNGAIFSTNTLTSPLWINIVWSYLYEWYGEPKYGYIPQWHGKGQEGQLISLPKTEDKTQDYYLILEPLGGIPLRYLDETLAEENSKSEIVEEVRWGELIVQKRKKLEI